MVLNYVLVGCPWESIRSCAVTDRSWIKKPKFNYVCVLSRYNILVFAPARMQEMYSKRPRFQFFSRNFRLWRLQVAPLPRVFFLLHYFQSLSLLPILSKLLLKTLKHRASSHEPSWPGWLGYRDEFCLGFICEISARSPRWEKANWKILGTSSGAKFEKQSKHSKCKNYNFLSLS